MYDIRYGSIILCWKLELQKANLSESVLASVSLSILCFFILCMGLSPHKFSLVSANLSQIYQIRYTLSFSFEVLIKK